MNAAKEAHHAGTSTGSARKPHGENGITPRTSGNVSVFGYGTEPHRAELAARSHRTRTAKEVEDDLQTACRAIGALAGGARLNAKPIDRIALKNVCEGVRRLLSEPMEHWPEHGQ